MRLHHLTTSLALSAALLVSGCTQYATVSRTRPVFRPVRAAVGALVSVERNFEDAVGHHRAAPRSALGQYLAAAKVSADHLEKNPNDAAALHSYNFAVARAVSIITTSKLDPWTQPLRVPSPAGEFVLTHKPDPRPAWNPTLYDFTPADEFSVGGSYMKRRVLKEGVGAPVVAIGREMNKESAKNFGIPRTFYGVTAVIRFDGRRAEIAFEDPLATERVALDGHTYPLAADFTVPIAVMLSSLNPKKLEMTRLLRPGKYAETARIARLQPYDPDKTVVLVIHGLMDSPATWAPMINTLRSDEQIRKNYQFWFYSYPSGYAYPYSAAILRRELDAIQQRFPLHKKIVLIGHSMGGCISRLMITDANEKLWPGMFGKPPEQVPLSAESRKLLSEALIFQHRPEVGRVIFISAPLRGSEMASNWVGRIGSSLVKSPSTFLEVGRDVLKVASFSPGDLQLKRLPNSVDTLAPNNRFVRLINTIPVTDGIPHHVISGDRGKGGNKDRTKPVMSDGIVPYWSSHMDTAESELVVPSNHSAHQNEQAIAEVGRILRQIKDN